ncbi:MAG TPA: HD domain-containing protein [Methanosarcina sp.]|nr:HD domain-containing protein [Methanosarcina sp.]
MKMILKAINFANARHEGQVRKGSGDPYITHPVAVSYILASFKKSKKMEELLAACILHDTLEDTQTNFVELATEFSPLVASLVFELTNDEEEIAKIGKMEYQKKKLLGLSNYGLLIKLADRLHNISDNPTKKMLDDTICILHHLVENRKLTKTQSLMVEEILKIIEEKTDSDLTRIEEFYKIQKS